MTQQLDHKPLEMVTFGVEHWGDDIYRIAVHGANMTKTKTPHIHIFLMSDDSHSVFNFAVSLVDILMKDEINLIVQYDKRRDVKNIHRNTCSWDGYAEILEGFEKFLFAKPNASKYMDFGDNLERAIYEWNRETDFQKTEMGGNPLKEYLDTKGVKILAKYQKYFEGEDG